MGNHYMAFGIMASWIAGIGRYWDNPRAEWWQYAGLGSVLYIFVMALILWLIIKPLKPQNWNYKNVLIFVGMTSPPGILYAIPVERFTSMESAQMINMWFLGVVALWRVMLWILYLKRSARLTGFVQLIGAILPLAIIVSILAFLNLEHVIFRIMGGLTDKDMSPNDGAYVIVVLLTYFSILASPVLLIAYIGSIIGIHRTNKNSATTT